MHVVFIDKVVGAELSRPGHRLMATKVGNTNQSLYKEQAQGRARDVTQGGQASLSLTSLILVSIQSLRCSSQINIYWLETLTVHRVPDPASQFDVNSNLNDDNLTT